MCLKITRWPLQMSSKANFLLLHDWGGSGLPRLTKRQLQTHTIFQRPRTQNKGCLFCISCSNGFNVDRWPLQFPSKDLGSLLNMFLWVGASPTHQNTANLHTHTIFQRQWTHVKVCFLEIHYKCVWKLPGDLCKCQAKLIFCCCMIGVGRGFPDSPKHSQPSNSYNISAP